MATTTFIRELKATIDESPQGRQLRDLVIRQADEFLAQKPIAWKSGEMLNHSRDALRRMQTVGIVWLLEGDSRYLERGKRELMAICELRDWHSWHFLTTAELIHAAAIGFDWFHRQLEPSERTKCVKAILAKGLRPGLRDLKRNTKWPRRVNNWNIVCNAGLMIGVLALAESAPKLAREVFERCLNSVPTGLHGYSPDGSWVEGPGYWSYATEYMGYLLASLKTSLGHQFGLGQLPAIENTGLFRLHATGASKVGKRARMFNFSDCEETRRGSWCLRWLSAEFNRPEYNRFAHNNDDSRAMDLLWFSPAKPAASIDRNAVFRGRANVAMLRAKSTDKTQGFRPWEAPHLHPVYVAIRAGANSYDNQHGHLDLGSFVLDADELRWATDLQPVDGDYYLQDYFEVAQNKRFRYYRTATIGHNTLVINGKNQPLGIETEIVACGGSDELLVAVADLTDAYPDCLRVRRGLALINDRQVLIVDELTPRRKISVAWQMHTGATPVEDQPGVLEQKDGKGKLKKFFVRILEPTTAALEIRPAEVTQGEAPNKDIQKLVATVEGVAKPLRIAVLLSIQDGKSEPWPELVDGPLWSWIEWAGRHEASKTKSFWTGE